MRLGFAATVNETGNILRVATVVVGLLFCLSAPDGAATGGANTERLREAQIRQAAQQEARAAQTRLEQERRRISAAAHARMPSTMHASTPSPPDAVPHCPVPPDGMPDEPIEDRYDRIIARSGADLFRPAGTRSGPSIRAALPASPAAAPSHRFAGAASGSAAAASASPAADGLHVHLFPSASESLRQGFVRVVNHSPDAGEVRIDPVDDSGRRFDALTLSIGGGAARHFNSGDLENGNADKGLSGGAGTGQGSWRLAFSSDLDIEVLAYVRTEDGFLTAMHDAAPREGNTSRVAVFNPGSNPNQVSRLRLVNPGTETARATIRGVDDRGRPGAGEVALSLAAGAAREITAAQLESGAQGLDGSLGDGDGKWRLEVESDPPVVAMSLLESPTGHLTNLSTVPPAPAGGVHGVPLFPSAADASGRQGFLRVVNRSETAGEVRIAAYDGTERDYPPATLALGAGGAAHLNSDDLEQGNARKGLTGSTGPGEGDWRLELTSALDIEVLAYVRTEDGFLTAMHDVAPSAGNRHRVAVFNPGANRNQESLLRLVNAGDAAASATVGGIDDDGAPGAGEVRLTVPAGGARTVSAAELESGGAGLEGALGDGRGKWRLTVESDAPVVAMSLLRSPTGHLTNLSTAPGRGAGAATAAEVFAASISPIVQSKCANCHVEGGVSGNTRLVFVRDTDADHLAKNLKAFEDFAAEADGGAALILNKVQGVEHGGGVQLAAGTDGFAAMERFVGLLGGDDGSSGTSATVATLFDGVRMESARSTLRRAAIVFAGRIPTDAEYASIEAGGTASLRKAIRGLMTGPGFHDFLIQNANDRLLTDRHLGNTIPNEGFFVDFDNEYYRLNEIEPDGSKRNYWELRAQYGAGRAPLELIAHVAKKDLPYTEVLTAPYIMANPWTANAYGADTAFDESRDVHEFKPSEIVRYYRNCDGKESEFNQTLGLRILDPGPCATDYPHAGVLNTTVFLKRYPTTATNRNRARSRWTYYHFLGLDIEKSASRTTDPDALADTNNPTMRNPACTVCHSDLDPVAGAFQNYGDVGLYRDQWGGLDSLDDLYKYDPPGGTDYVIGAAFPDARDTVAFSVDLDAGTNTLAFRVVEFPGFEEPAVDIGIDYLLIGDGDGNTTRYELENLQDWEDQDCGHPSHEDSAEASYRLKQCILRVDVEAAASGTHEVEVAAWIMDNDDDRPGAKATLRIWPRGDHLYLHGDTWYRDMRIPGFDGRIAPNADNSLQWLADGIVADPRFAEATVKFWWPAIMGADVVEPPSEGDPDFAGRLLASNAQRAEVQRLAGAFRRGFGGGQRYNLKDLLTEIALSKWFRATWTMGGDSIRTNALASAGARRLLTPEELSRKTVAVTGFDWQRWRLRPWENPGEALNWTNAKWKYGLLYGGIDSDGITERGRDFTSVMAGVAQRHAAAVACPVAMKDFYLVEEPARRLFGGVGLADSPVSEFSSMFDIAAESWSQRETLVQRGDLRSGTNRVGLRFANNDGDDSGGDRNVRLYRLDVRDADRNIVQSVDLADLDAPQADWGPCGGKQHDSTGRAHFNLHSSCKPAFAEVEIPADGTYRIEVVAWADQYGSEPARLEVAVESDTERSARSRAIRTKLAELHRALLGVEADADSADVRAAYDLFVDVWNRGRDASDDANFSSLRCDWPDDEHYFDGIRDDFWREELDEHGNQLGWDWDRVNAYFEARDWPDPHHVARTWVAVLAYLMADPRYLHL